MVSFYLNLSPLFVVFSIQVFHIFVKCILNYFMLLMLLEVVLLCFNFRLFITVRNAIFFMLLLNFLKLSFTLCLLGAFKNSFPADFLPGE